MEHVHLTVCARDNITLRLEQPDCMNALSDYADRMNDRMEACRDVMALAISDLAVFGTALLPPIF